VRIKPIKVILTGLFKIFLAFLFLQAVVPSVKAQHQGHVMDSEQSPTKPPDVKQGPAEETPKVMIPVDKQQLIGVKTVEVSIKPLEKSIRTVGRIEYDERRLATVNTKVEGWIVMWTIPESM